VRQDGIFQCFVGAAVDYNGVRYIIGVLGQVSEAEIHWRDFMEYLNLRGLKGVQMIISGAHARPREAIF
jgi:transposase-like protein